MDLTGRKYRVQSDRDTFGAQLARTCKVEDVDVFYVSVINYETYVVKYM
jgi:hypothetical protein